MEIGGKKKEFGLLLGNKYLVKLQEEHGVRDAFFHQPKKKFSLKMLEISRGSLVVLLSLGRLSIESVAESYRGGRSYKGTAVR